MLPELAVEHVTNIAPVWEPTVHILAKNMVLISQFQDKLCFSSVVLGNSEAAQLRLHSCLKNICRVLAICEKIHISLQPPNESVFQECSDAYYGIAC